MVDDTLGVDSSGRIQVNSLGAAGEDFTKNPANGIPTAGGSEAVRGAIFSDAFTLPVLIGNQTFDSASLVCYGPKKVVWIIVTTAVVFAAAGQATIQFFATRIAVAAAPLPGSRAS